MNRKNRGARSLVCLGLALWLASCSRAKAPEQVGVLSALPEQAQVQPDYIASFQTQEAADRHSKELQSRGSRIQSLDSSGRTLRIQSTASALEGVMVPSSTLLSANTSVKILARAQSASNTGGTAAPSHAAAVESFLTARREVGVEALLAKMPTADGRGIKVAVFDTGIDFGVEGLQKFKDGRQKLRGFYDATDFGKVSAVPIADVSTLKFTAGLRPRKLVSTGALEELEMAKSYLAAVVDINANDKKDDVFKFVTGVNEQGLPAVWIDANQDGVFGPAQDEELTDFNQTYRYIDLRKDVAKSGARPLAVTLVSDSLLHFHSVPEGHGTGCALIIGGDGYAGGTLRGMAPGTELYSWSLDATGQDVYTLDQFLKMFLKAKEVGVDAISISWGFATADLASARFVADFLDREIASAGILIAIAAGNEGPGVSTATADDYIPHHGIGVGAAVTEAQARSLYGWTGTQGNGIIWYSSFGPTRGGRQIPDLASPLMTLVRTERGIAAPQFYPFSGTSSATPALVGASAALMSAIKQSGEAKINPRLLKLALQATAKPLEQIESIRQGAGFLNVSEALEVYLRLAGEERAGSAHVDVRARIPLERNGVAGEGIRYSGYRPTAIVEMALTAASQASVDPLTYVETLAVRTQSDFLTVPQGVVLQASGAKFTAQIDPRIAGTPGTYSDLIELVRPRDGLVLARVPVVIEIPSRTSATMELMRVNRVFKPFDVARMPVHLDQAAPLIFDGVVQELAGGEGATFGFGVRNADGVSVFEMLSPIPHVVNALQVQTPELPPGDYEVVLFRHFARPAVLADVQVTGVVRQPFARVLAARQTGRTVEISLSALEDLAVAQATLRLAGSTRSVTLKKDVSASRPGFYGQAALAPEQKTLALRLRQSAFDRHVEGMLHHSLAIVGTGSRQPMYRGWINLAGETSPFSEVGLEGSAATVDLISYPNIVDWKEIKTESLIMDYRVPFARAEEVTVKAAAMKALQRATLKFELAEGSAVDETAYGSLELLDGAKKVWVSLPLSGFGGR